MEPKKKTQTGRRARGGSALLTTVIALFVLTGATLLILTQSASALHVTRRDRAAATAFNLAESGAELAALWLRKQPYPPAGLASLAPFGAQQPLGEGTYSLTVIPDRDNETAYLKRFKVISHGTVRQQKRTVEVVLQQASFGRYAYFTDQELSVNGSPINFRTGDTIDGPAHSNNSNGTNFRITYTGSDPIFLDSVTAVGTTINYSPGQPTNEAAFQRIYREGSLGYQLGVAYVPLPSTTDVQREAAWGSASGYPTANGVYLRPDADGGFYVRGDAAIRFSVNGSGNQVITITQGSKVTSLTLDRATKSVTASGPMGPGSPTSASSLGTGVIYCTGNVTSLQGEIADNRVVGSEIETRSEFTLATDVNAGKDIKVTGNLTYRTRPDKTLDAWADVNLRAGTLGLVARNTTIASTAPQNLEIDAVTLSGSENLSEGSFSVENYSTKKPTGTLKVIGGIIQKKRGAVGTFNSSTGAMTTGYEKDYNYDTRLATHPPPYFPTTGGYERLSWRLLPVE
ncbi:MAG TPA: hypothetical protein VM490_08975 [Armatimonadaceae bacterium]|nr:hypothetical protein [Armatimonadaceae bacterium]